MGLGGLETLETPKWIIVIHYWPPLRNMADTGRPGKLSKYYQIGGKTVMASRTVWFSADAAVLQFQMTEAGSTIQSVLSALEDHLRAMLHQARGEWKSWCREWNWWGWGKEQICIFINGTKGICWSMNSIDKVMYLNKRVVSSLHKKIIWIWMSFFSTFRSWFDLLSKVLQALLSWIRGTERNHTLKQNMQT